MWRRPEIMILKIHQGILQFSAKNEKTEKRKKGRRIIIVKELNLYRSIISYKGI